MVNYPLAVNCCKNYSAGELFFHNAFQNGKLLLKTKAIFMVLSAEIGHNKIWTVYCVHIYI